MDNVGATDGREAERGAMRRPLLLSILLVVAALQYGIAGTRAAFSVADVAGARTDAEAAGAVSGHIVAVLVGALGIVGCVGSWCRQRWAWRLLRVLFCLCALLTLLGTLGAALRRVWVGAALGAGLTSFYIVCWAYLGRSAAVRAFFGTAVDRQV